MKRVIQILSVILIVLMMTVSAYAATESDTKKAPENVILFTNVNIFNGIDDKLYENHNVLVEGNIIKSISADPIPVNRAATTKVIDGAGQTLMPGLIDSHVHFNMMVDGGPAGLESKTWEEIGTYAVYAAQEWLKNGFTTARDMCGMHQGMRKVIDKGLIEGPRIYLSGACLSQTSGHGDFRHESDGVGQFDRPKGNTINLGITRVVDGRAEVLGGSRANFAGGADYLKMMIGGGVSSEKDPLHSIQFTPDEVKAAVEAAEQWDTYVAAHVYKDEHIQRGLDLGIKVFDHAQFITEKTARNLKKKGAFISPNVAAMNPDLLKHPVYGNPEGPQYPKVLEFMESSKNLFSVLKKVQPKIVFNTDIVFTTGTNMRSHIDHEKYFVAKGIGNFAALKAMTSTGGELAALTGENNPYPGKLGVIEKGALADILIVDGNPLVDISAIGGHPQWLDAPPRGPEVDSIKLIMKDGKIYKNTL